MGLIYGPGDVSWFFQILFHYFVIKETCDFWLFADPQFLHSLIPKILEISLWSAVCDLEGRNAVLCLNIKVKTIGTLISFPLVIVEVVQVRQKSLFPHSTSRSKLRFGKPW